MTKLSRKKSLCLFYILALLFWNLLSGLSSASEMVEEVYGGENYYVNQSSPVTITSLYSRLPLRESLSVKDSEGPETLSATGIRGTRTLPRSARFTSIDSVFPASTSDLYSVYGQFHPCQMLVHSLCGIIITNYIHHQDGQKS